MKLSFGTAARMAGATTVCLWATAAVAALVLRAARCR